MTHSSSSALAVAGAIRRDGSVPFRVLKLLQRHGLMSDINVWELNEAFAVQVPLRDRSASPAKKRQGARYVIGHPFGMTGSRMVGTLANESSAARRGTAGDDLLGWGKGSGAVRGRQ